MSASARGPVSAVCGAAFAALYAFGMPGYGVPVVPFVALAPLVHLGVSAGTGRQAAARGFLWGTAANLLLYYWIAYTVAVPGRLGWAAGAAAALAVAAYLALYLAAACAAAHRLERRFGEAGLFAFPVVFVGLEHLRAVFLTGFPWLLLGYGVAERPLLRQAADLAGAPGLGLLLALASVGAYVASRRIGRGETRAALLPAVAAAAVPAFLLAYGAVAGRIAAPEDAPLRVAVAQGGIDQSVKWDPAYQTYTLDVYAELTRRAAAGGAEVVVWPETAAPFFYGWEPELSRRVDRMAAEGGVPLVFGAPWFEPSGGGRYYNSVFLLDARGVPAGRYDKRHLVPFGEYIPLREVLFFLRKMTAGEGDFSAGEGPALLRIRGTVAGASVCYEAVFPGIIRESVRAGAGWLVNVTNDAWFGDTVAPRQHLAMARLRAVEFRRPMVRAANSGISAAIDATGKSLVEIPLGRREMAEAVVRPRGGETVYAKTGDLLSVFCFIIAILTFMVPSGRRHGHGNPGREDHRPRRAIPRP